MCVQLTTYLRHLQVPWAPIEESKGRRPNNLLDFLRHRTRHYPPGTAFTPRKIQHLKTSIAEWSRRKACRKKELLSLIGSLSHACTVIVPGHIFMRWLITTSCRAKNLSHWIRLDAEFRSDLAWWSSFLDKWNGRSMMEVHAPSWNPTVEFS